MSAFLIVFFRDWGALSQFQVQFLQAWFAFWIVFFEIPTGLLGDLKGRKFSVLVGFLFIIVGYLVYGSYSNFYVFMLGEFIIAFGSAFCSGAQEALLYDTALEKGYKAKYHIINVTESNLHLAGMLVGSFVSGLLIKAITVNRLVQLNAIPVIIGLILMLLFIKEPKQKLKEELVPDYKNTFKSALKAVKRNKILKRLIVFIVGISSLTHFSIWFYQVGLRELNVPDAYYVIFRILLLASEIFLSYVIVRLLKKSGKKLLVLFFVLSLVSLGFLVPGINLGLISVLFMVVFSGGIGMKIRSIFSPFLNAQIESKNRATVLSFVSLLVRLLLIVLNLIFGYLVDINFSLTLIILGICILGIAIIWGPQEEDLADSQL